ncbi:MAG: glycoside hydrolase family 2 TIM barrel-domain containing protein [Bacteroidales bacterium]
MKHAVILLTILAFSLSPTAKGQRVSRLENFDWKYARGIHPGAHEISFDDSGWETVHLPHDASIAGPFVCDSLNADRKNGFLPRTRGWYRKELTIGENLTDKTVFLEFEGVYRDARVYLNGKEVARQLNGFLNFTADLTGIAVRGKNILAVSYDNTDMESSRWYNGEGIYRDVWLHILSPVHVAYHGTFVYTPVITRAEAVAEIHTEIWNKRNGPAEITLLSEIFSPSGRKVAGVADVVPVSSNECYTFRQTVRIPDPLLWEPGSPRMYTLKTTVKEGQQALDCTETPFGIRSLYFDRARGFLLNGKKVLIKGVNLHHDLGPLGAAAFERGIARRLEGLKAMGCNAVRLSHNPHDSYILDWCDRNGMLVLDEAFDKWDDQFFGQGNAFETHWRQSLEAFIRRDRNHPCVFLWSVGNETRQQRDPDSGFGVPLLKEMTAFVKNLDPSRQVTCALHPSRKSGAYRTPDYYREGPPEMVFYMDVVSTNYREEFWPVDKNNYPQLIFLLSEAQAGNLGNEWFNFDHRSSVGLFYWGGTDYIGESFGWPAKGWANGIIDWNDHWKPFTYYIKSLFSKDPMVHITTFDPDDETAKYWNEVQLRYQPMFSHWNHAGKDSVRLLTFSNCHEVELFINGRSFGTRQVPQEYYTKDIRGYTAEEYNPDRPVNFGPSMHRRLEWTVPWETGRIVAEGRIDGKMVARHELVTAGKPHRLVLEADRDSIHADGLDLSYITVKVTDRNGIPVPGASHQVKFTVSGPGSLAGTGSADILSNEPFTSPIRRLFQGKALLIVRSGRTPGAIRIRAEAEGLPAARLEIQATDRGMFR